MKLYIDNNELFSVGSRVNSELGQKITYEKLLKQGKNKSLKNFIDEVGIPTSQIYDRKQELNTSGYQAKNLIQKDVDEIKHKQTKDFPSIIKIAKESFNLDIYPRDISSYLSQGDFVCVDGSNLHVFELKATFWTLGQAIDDPYHIVDSAKKVKAQNENNTFGLLLCRIKKEDFKEYFLRSGHGKSKYVTWDDYENFKKILSRNEIQFWDFCVEKDVYAQPVSNYYADKERNEPKFIIKQEETLRKLNKVIKKVTGKELFSRDL